MRVVDTAGAAGTITVLWNLETKGVSAKVRDLAKEFDGSFRIATLEFSICRTHAAKRLELTGGADGLTSARGLANVLETALPTLFESAVANVGAVLMGEDADGHLPLRIYGAAILTAAAGIFLGALAA